ncbi:MAG: iron-containing alcohol dehydrogenase [Verrucomicrobia bacterium]|nr:iron-containing alcohol dehydrogenase [Verrucomicrobiota bacterium]MBU1910626.1 iron-containing alcohol dehydrogenase [Verrucomicrobiota bacterium]
MAVVPTAQKAREVIEAIHRYGLKAPRTIIFGKNRLTELGDLAFLLAAGRKALLLLGGASARHYGLDRRIVGLLSRHGITTEVLDGIHGEPTVARVDELAARARELQPGLIVSAGGGSVMDSGKAVATLAVNDGSVEEYLEGEDEGRTMAAAPLPHITIPTVAGTGAEMTHNAVIGSPEKKFKRSMRADSMIPTIAVIDSMLTLSVPHDVTASGGMDALTQLIESCISNRRRPETTALAQEGLRLAREAISVSVEAPGNEAARDKMALVSMLGGVCLANAGLAMAHGIAAALGALYGVPHGLACGILLPYTLRYNASACSHELAHALSAFLNQGGMAPRIVEEGIAAIEKLADAIGIPADLKEMGLQEEDVQEVARHSMGTSMSGNPIPMTPEQVAEFLRPLV